MTWLFIVLNVLAFALTLLAGADPTQGSAQVMLNLGANYPPLTLRGEPWRLFTAMFLHWGWPHLLMNMVALWSGGRIVETWYGAWRYTLLYLGSGLAAGLVSSWWHPEALGAGASGAVFGVFGALFAVTMLASNKRSSTHSASAQNFRSSLWSFISYNVLFGLIFPQIDMAAHVGGFISGGVLALVLRPSKP